MVSFCDVFTLIELLNLTKNKMHFSCSRPFPYLHITVPDHLKAANAATS